MCTAGASVKLTEIRISLTPTQDSEKNYALRVVAFNVTGLGSPHSKCTPTHYRSSGHTG